MTEYQYFPVEDIVANADLAMERQLSSADVLGGVATREELMAEARRLQELGIMGSWRKSRYGFMGPDRPSAVPTAAQGKNIVSDARGANVREILSCL